MDEAKRRVVDGSSELNEVCKERDAAKLERNDFQVKHAKELDGERTNRRVLQAENDKLKFR